MYDEAYVLLGKKHSPSLKMVDYELKITSLFLEVTLTQRFVNDSKKSLEAVYVLPKSGDAIVTRFSFETGGRMYRTTVDEKESAFKKYEAAMKKGHGAALLDEVNGDLLQISVGNLKPAQEVTFSIQWVQSLRVMDDRISVFFPLSRFPRYKRAAADPVQADVQNANLTDHVPYGMALRVLWDAASIAKCESSTHDEWKTLDAAEGSHFPGMSLSGEADAFRADLTLTATPMSSDTGIACLATHASGESIVYGRFSPHTESVGPAIGKEVVFILDCSGSMEGEPIACAKQALEVCLRSLGKEDTFWFVRFGTQFEVIKDGDRPFAYNDCNLTAALTRVAAFNADMGGTELHAALAQLLTTTAARTEWILLTDGGVSDPESVKALIIGSEHKPRIFTFGIGNGASTTLCQGLARVSGGACEMVMSEKNLAETVLRQFARIDQPRFTDVSVKADSCTLESSEPLDAVFDGDGWEVVARVDGETPKRITLTATVDGRVMEWDLPITSRGKWDAPGALWAGRRTHHLETTGSAHASHQQGRAGSSDRKEALRIALQFQVLCEQTSFVGIEERDADGRWTERPEFEIVQGLMSRGRDGTIIFGDPAALNMVVDSTGPSFLRRTRCATVCEESSALAPLYSRRLGARRDPAPPPTTPWHIALTMTLTAYGSFDTVKAMPILRERIRKFDEVLKQVKSQLAGHADAEEIALSLIAVKLLESDDAARSACRKPLRKARAWLRDISVGVGLMDGIVLRVGESGISETC